MPLRVTPEEMAPVAIVSVGVGNHGECYRELK